jgi:hypothetical protein
MESVLTESWKPFLLVEVVLHVFPTWEIPMPSPAPGVVGVAVLFSFQWARAARRHLIGKITDMPPQISRAGQAWQGDPKV